MEPRLSPWLEEKVRNGEAILFLGAGATRGASGPRGEKPLSGNELRDVLADRFLGGALKDKPLAQVAEYAKAESSLVDVQTAIYELFEPLQPAQCHLLIPSFRWYAIVTTNYDFIVERSYVAARDPLQQLSPIIRDENQLGQTLRNLQAVPYLKLHGCLSTINDPKLPLILASEEYARFRQGRTRLFSYFQDWARENPIVFCGYNVADPNIQQILFDLADLGINRPEYAVVSPGLTEFDVRYWQSRRFLPIKATFEDFVRNLDVRISKPARIISTLRKRDASSIQDRVQNGQPTEQLLLYLDQAVEHVRVGMAFDAVSPAGFYRGEAHSWSPIVQNLDVQRRLTDDILIEAVLDKPAAPKPQIFLIKGHAGSGKSVTLRRIAWNASTEHGAFVFWLREGGFLRSDLIRELYVLTGERVFVFVEDAIPHLEDISTLLRVATKDQLPVTLIIGARSNEWNVAGTELDPNLARSYELRDLSSAEIDQLLANLERHQCLGALRDLPPVERRRLFELSAERQLLVALHEATMGTPFQDIVVDEYQKVVPLEAQALYLDVCTLHRFRVGIRAGLLSRVSGITFNYFSDRLLGPLEHVVKVYFDPSSRDYAYRTRHPVIADMVFRSVLFEQEKRASQIIRIVRSMNVNYESDALAFEQLVRGRDLAELFDDRVMADRIFEAALAGSASVSHVEHQRAIFELNHPGGSAVRALKAIEHAGAVSNVPSAAILHTKAMVLRRMAQESPSALEREKYRADAKAILERQIRRGITPHPYHTLGRIVLDELEERLDRARQEEGSELEDRVLSDLIVRAEEIIALGLQRFPAESYLLDLEARLARHLNDRPRAAKAVQKAYDANPGNGYVAVRLAEQYLKNGDSQGARQVLVRCIDQNPTNKIAHLQLAKYLIDEDARANSDAIRSHLRASFTEGDTNYDAQFWYARHEFLYGDRVTAGRIFEHLAKAKVAPEVRNRIRGEIIDRFGKPLRFQAHIATVQDTYCFGNVQELNISVFIHHTQFNENQWGEVRPNKQIRLSIGFNFRGPVGAAVEIVQ
jgi:hypothetical protein